MAVPCRDRARKSDHGSAPRVCGWSKSIDRPCQFIAIARASTFVDADPGRLLDRDRLHPHAVAHDRLYQLEIYVHIASVELCLLLHLRTEFLRRRMETLNYELSDLNECGR